MLIVWFIISLFVLVLAYTWRMYIQMYHWKNKVLVNISNAVLIIAIIIIIVLIIVSWMI